MLPSNHRLTVEGFEEVYNRGTNTNSSSLFLKLLREQGSTRFAVAVPKSVAKTKVARNRLRRQGYALIEGLWQELGATGVHAILFFKKGSEKKSFAELSEEMRGLCEAAGLLTAQ